MKGESRFEGEETWIRVSLKRGVARFKPRSDPGQLFLHHTQRRKTKRSPIQWTSGIRLPELIRSSVTFTRAPLSTGIPKLPTSCPVQGFGRVERCVHAHTDPGISWMKETEMFFDCRMTSPSSLMNSQFHPVCPEFRPRTPTPLWSTSVRRNRLDGMIGTK